MIEQPPGERFFPSSSWRSRRRSFVVDADSHVLEPPDLWARYVDPVYRDRAIQVVTGKDGRSLLLVGGRPAHLTTPEMLGGIGCMGEDLGVLAEAATSGRYLAAVPRAAFDPRQRLALLDEKGISHAILYPTLGLQWEAEAPDAAYAFAHAQAYNRWIEAFCAESGGRLVPVAHLVLGDAWQAARELERAVAAGARGGFLLPFTWDGLPHGHTDHDLLWAKAQELDVPIAIHTGVDPPARSLHHRYDGLSWPEAVPGGIWYLQLMFAQAVQQAFSSFFLCGTFDRFPRLKLVLLESGAGWLPYWMDRMDNFYKGPLRVTMPLKDLPSSYVLRQCWIAADPDERFLPAVVQAIGEDRVLWASDFPHSDHAGDYMEELEANLRRLRPAAARRIRGENAARLYGLC